MRDRVGRAVAVLLPLVLLAGCVQAPTGMRVENATEGTVWIDLRIVPVPEGEALYDSRLKLAPFEVFRLDLPLAAGDIRVIVNTNTGHTWSEDVTVPTSYAFPGSTPPTLNILVTDERVWVGLDPSSFE